MTILFDNFPTCVVEVRGNSMSWGCFRKQSCVTELIWGVAVQDVRWPWPLASGIYPLLLPPSSTLLARNLSINGSTSPNKSVGGKVAKCGQQKPMIRNVGGQYMTSGIYSLLLPLSSSAASLQNPSLCWMFLSPAIWINWQQWPVASIHSSFLSLPTRHLYINGSILSWSLVLGSS